MDFDHRDPKEKMSGISEMVAGGYTDARIEEEVAKCDVVCANCHRLREHERRALRAFRTPVIQETGGGYAVLDSLLMPHPVPFRRWIGRMHY